MSINSLQDQMSRRAASIAAMAERVNDPQQIQAIRQRLVAEIQNGTIKPYVGVPLVQELTQKINAAQAKVAQAIAGAGIPQSQGGEPIAQQVMQQAEQGGVPTLQSNLPQEYAGGGIVAFSGGATVPGAGLLEFLKGMGVNAQQFIQMTPQQQAVYREMFASQAPAAQAAPVSQAAASPAAQAATQGSKMLGAYAVPAAVGYGGLKLSNAAANMVANATPEQREQFMGYGADPSGTSFAAAIMNAANPAQPKPAQEPPKPFQITTSNPTQQGPGDPVVSRAGTRAETLSPDLFRQDSGGGIGNLKLPTYTPKAAPDLTDLQALVSGLPKEAQKAFDEARDKEENYLRALTEPGEKAREEKFNLRAAAQEKDAAMTRAMNIIGLGFGIAGSKERTLAGALGNEVPKGIANLIQGEAANRAAKEKLEDARDNFEQQKIASKKGDRAAAKAAGKEASDDLLKYATLNVHAAQAGNSEALQRWTGENSAALGAAQLQQQGILGLASLRQQADANARPHFAAEAAFKIMRKDPANKGKSDTELFKEAANAVNNYGTKLAGIDLKAQSKIADIMQKYAMFASMPDSPMRTKMLAERDAQIAQIKKQDGSFPQGGDDFTGFRMVK